MATRQEKLKVLLWSLYHYPRFKWQSWKTRREKARLQILTSQQTIERIVSEGLSVARYGDGELQMVSHYLQGGDESNFEVDTFQNYNPDLAKRLHDLLEQPQKDKLLLCLPYQLKEPTISNLYGELFWEREWLARKDFLVRYVLDRVLGDTNFTRFYMGRRDIGNYKAYISLLWDILPSLTSLTYFPGIGTFSRAPIRYHSYSTST